MMVTTHKLISCCSKYRQPLPRRSGLEARRIHALDPPMPLPTLRCLYRAHLALVSHSAGVPRRTGRAVSAPLGSCLTSSR